MDKKLRQEQAINLLIDLAHAVQATYAPGREPPFIRNILDKLDAYLEPHETATVSERAEFAIYSGPTPNEHGIYRVKVKHDNGVINIDTNAAHRDAAIRTIMAAERCPERSIISVRRIK